MNPNADAADLAQRFRELTDDELVSLCRAHRLTELAQSIAVRELRARGLDVPEEVSAADGGAENSGEFQVVARYLHPTEAHIARARLEASGIPAMVADANLVQMNYLWAAALGGVRILVPASRAAEARAVIAALERGAFALRDGDLP